MSPSPTPRSSPDTPIDLRELARQRRRWEDVSRRVGGALVVAFHHMILFIIGSATIWAALSAVGEMIAQGHVSIGDLLLLFIYLEIGAMVGIYFQTNHMPVRFLIYVGITALTRHLIDLVNTTADTTTILIWSGSVLVLAVSVVVLSFATFHYSSDKRGDGQSDSD